jgi:hypothetical protein
LSMRLAFSALMRPWLRLTVWSLGELSKRIWEFQISAHDSIYAQYSDRLPSLSPLNGFEWYVVLQVKAWTLTGGHLLNLRLTRNTEICFNFSTPAPLKKGMVVIF